MSILFIGKSLLVSGLLLGYYWVFLRNRKMHAFNRFYLIVTVALSVVVPTLHFSIDMAAPVQQTGVYRMLQVVGGGEEDVLAGAEQHINMSLEQVMTYGYVLSVIVMLTVMLIKLRWVFRLNRKYSAVRMDGYTLVHTDLGNGPFSFMRTIYWSNKTDLNSMAGQDMLRHERTHVRQLHTLDKLFIQLVLAFHWFNPFFWLIRKELSMVHEFIADEGMHDTESFAHMMLRSYLGDRMPAIVNPFFHSPIKRRLLMITRNNAPRMARLRKYAVIPLLAAVVLLVSFTVNKPGSKTDVIKAKRKLLVVLDAGHGGNDRGAVSTFGKAEKDVTLDIVRQLGTMAPDHNIEVHYTREGDNYSTLQQRVELANALPADLFLSIHVSVAGEPKSEGFGFGVSRKSARYNESKALASAIGSKLASVDAHPYYFEKSLHVLRDNNHTALVLECSNIENANIRDAKYMEGICRNVLNGIAEYENELK
jgi:N-acetylmuramoyl-L-alanine amidase